MKKIYLLSAAALFSMLTHAQTAFFEPVNYAGAFPITDGMSGTSSNDWTAGWAEFDPQSKVYGSATVTVSANITSTTTWTSNNVYSLVGNIAVTSGNTLVIQPGTVIRGDLNTKSCLIIAAGAKIHANGTQANPIVFTSGEAEDSRDYGDWGGLIILGNGITNTSCATCTAGTNYIEGFASSFPEILYGGNNNADSSGVLSHVRIEFAGVALSSTANSEINGLTMGGVGSKTQIDHIQVSYCGDDSYEFFGGAVNAKHLIAFAGLDDDFDTDFGWSGNVQFGLSVRDKDASDAAGDSNSFESDNYNPGTGRTPLTSGIFSNMTLIGPKRDGNTALPGVNYYGKGLRLRRNTSISLFNSIVVGWTKGLSVEGSATEDNYTADSCVFSHNLIVGATNSATTANNAFYSTFFGADGNDSTKTAAQVLWVNAFPTLLEDGGDFRLTSANSAAASFASFSDSKLSGLVLGVANSRSMVGKNVSVYPNPASAQFFVNIQSNEAVDVVVNVYNITGQSVLSVKSSVIANANNKVAISSENLPAGVYFVNVNGNGINKTEKLTINN